MGLVYRSIIIHPWLSFMLVTPKKCTSESLMSDMNFMVLWMLFRSHMKESTSSLECSHMIKVSSDQQGYVVILEVSFKGVHEEDCVAWGTYGSNSSDRFLFKVAVINKFWTESCAEGKE